MRMAQQQNVRIYSDHQSIRRTRLWQWSAGLVVHGPCALHYGRHFKSTLGQWPNANCDEVITRPRPSTFLRGNLIDIASSEPARPSTFTPNAKTSVDVQIVSAPE